MCTGLRRQHHECESGATWQLGSSAHCSSQGDRHVNISTFVNSPELELFVHNVPAQAFGDSGMDMQLPTADFYLDCLVSEGIQL